MTEMRYSKPEAGGSAHHNINVVIVINHSVLIHLQLADYRIAYFINTSMQWK